MKPIALPKYSRHALIVTFALTLLALSSPFVYVDGLNNANRFLLYLGQIGIAVSILSIFVLPFLPKRFGFRLYDFTAILMALIFAGIQAPNFLRDPADEQKGYNEGDAIALAEELQEYARTEKGDTLPDFFLEKLGEAAIEIRKDKDENTSYQLHKGKYEFKLILLPKTTPDETGFTLTALAAPDADMRSFFMDKNGKMTFFSLKITP